MIQDVPSVNFQFVVPIQNSVANTIWSQQEINFQYPWNNKLSPVIPNQIQMFSRTMHIHTSGYSRYSPLYQYMELLHTAQNILTPSCSNSEHSFHEIKVSPLHTLRSFHFLQVHAYYRLWSSNHANNLHDASSTKYFFTNPYNTYVYLYASPASEVLTFKFQTISSAKIYPIGFSSTILIFVPTYNCSTYPCA